VIGGIEYELDAHAGRAVRTGLAGFDDPPNHPPKQDRVPELGRPNREGEHSSLGEGPRRADEGPTSADVVGVVRQEGVEAIVVDRQLDAGPTRFSPFSTTLRHAPRDEIRGLAGWRQQLDANRATAYPTGPC